nr:MBL fold metallo-hydrolase [uncultured Peptostreptococcus sp.]
MNLKYIYHSSFLLELENAYFLFDYFKGQVPNIDNDKKLYVFVSHGHSDHYCEDIFMIFKDHANVQYILSNDIPYKKREVMDRIHYLDANKNYEIDSLKINTYLSTDLGLAYMISYEGKTIYHAGDLNWWTWVGYETQDEFEDLTKKFKAEINKMEGRIIDLAMIPLDPRQGERFDWGMKYFIEKIRCKNVAPMHCWDKFEVIDKFREKNSELLTNINFIDTSKIGKNGIEID